MYDETTNQAKGLYDTAVKEVSKCSMSLFSLHTVVSVYQDLSSKTIAISSVFPAATFLQCHCQILMNSTLVC